ncbi:electron transport complex subunit RsxC [Denitrificimonas sp. JX-1]|uniref:Ion-translocating oxidoreductase complex subunit C n=1 Tax=Denitrificimonas halotolerans TaxID=3098930 RepID=A0ABU5GT54_9GAMM|nr:electron transport complex subunit RsxC [Denitrificimonas sp. JX-1]MDY7220164.1 electron transport complex subunit RsxC [Denitrificimonas sp. JX-1]
MSTWLIHPLRGGIHPPDCKTLSNQQPIQRAPLPKQLIVPLLQHIGHITQPVVKVGDYVYKGQLLADSTAPLSAPVHAPSSGTISFIGPQPYPHVSGEMLDAIVIDTDGLDAWCELRPTADFTKLAIPDLLDKIRQAGISGLGGAGFPTSNKLSPRADQPISTLIINGAECEPYITADDVLMRERATELILGIDILAHILQPKNVLIAIEDNKPEAISAMQQAAQARDYHVVKIPTIYPSGGERQLIQILTGQEVRAGQIPAQQGIVCQNIGTVLAVHDAVINGKPLISRITTLTGQALQTPMNVECLIGTPVHELLAFAGLQNEHLSRLVAGGPMMGFTLIDTAAPVIKTSNCFLAATAQELPPPPPTMPCIRCGDCAEVCPANLLPQQLHFYALGNDHEQLEAHNLFDCIECGACAYVCPSSIPLVQYYRAAKADMREQEQKQVKAEHAKERFEFRQERLRLEEERKEAARKERAERLARSKAKQAKKAEQNKSDGNSDSAAAQEEIKRLKIASSMAQVALRKAQKQFDEHGTDELKAQVTQLSAAAEEAKQALHKATSKAEATVPPKQGVTDDELKRLKITASMARVALTKAQKQLEAHGTDELKAQVEQLSKAADEAKQALDKANEKATVSAPQQSSANEVKRLKIAASMARVALTKAQKQLEAHGTDELKAQVEQLSKAADEAKQALTAATARQAADPKPTEKPAKPEPSAAEQALKKAKIEAAMKRAALRKAERAQADASSITALQAELAEAEQHLAKLNQSETADV